MATVTVDQNTIIGTSEYRPGGLAAQRFLRGQSISAAEKNVALDVLADVGVDALAYHWSGGWVNGQPGFQQLGGEEADFSPAGSTPATRQWAALGSQNGLDTNFGYLDQLRTRRPGAQMVLIMWDFPVTMLPVTTLSGAITSGQTTIPVTAATDFPTSGSYDIRIDSEYMTVTSGAGGLTWTVTRNQAASGAAAHSSGATVQFARFARIQPQWPGPGRWGGGTGLAGGLASEIISRYGATKIRAFSYGQELKGIAKGSLPSTAFLSRFTAGFETFATYMTANHPSMELWYPHLNFWATDTLAVRQASMDALIAGGSSLAPNDELMVNRMMDDVDPDHVDRFTYDASIVDNNAADSWRGNYAAVEQRLNMEFHLQRVLKAKMLSRWGVEKPLVAIESYFDVNQTAQDWATEAQSAALQTAIAMWAMKGGVTYHFKWEPQGGTPGGEAPDGNIASWFKGADGTAYAAAPQLGDLTAAVAPGSDLFSSTTDNTHINVVAADGPNGKKLVFLNTSGSTVSVGAASADGTSWTIAPADVAAYSLLIQDLPDLATSTLLLSDDFNRTSVDSFGTATSGQSWAVGGTASRYQVNNGRGHMLNAAGNTSRAWVSSFSAVNVDVTVTVQGSVRAATAVAQWYLTARNANLENDFVQAVLQDATGSTRPNLSVGRRIAAAEGFATGGSPVTLDTAHGHDEGVFAALTDYKIRMRVTGTNPTVIDAKAWKASGTEPTHWCIQGATVTTAESAAINASGGIGLRAYNATGSTAGTMDQSFETLTVADISANSFATADALHLADSVTRAQANTRTAAGSLAISDAATRNILTSGPKTTSDAVHISDAATRGSGSSYNRYPVTNRS